VLLAGRYTLLSPLGRGGMGQVWEGRGYTIGDVIAEQGPLPVPWVAAIGAQVAAVLAVAHEREIIHRDVKPQNVMLARDGTVKVLDFGVAGIISHRITRTGVAVGTPAYMAPEQAYNLILGRRDSAAASRVPLTRTLCATIRKLRASESSQGDAVGIILTGLVTVLGAGLVATALAMAIHGRIRQDTLTDFRDHSGLVSGVSGTLFAITVGMLVVASWGAIGTAKDNAAAEARSLDDLAWFAHTMPQPYENHVTALLQVYTQQVVNQDWPEMGKTETLSQPAWSTLNAIRYEFSVYTPKSQAEVSRYQGALDQLQNVYDDRLTRQDEVRTSVPSILWLALVVSGSIVVLVPVVFGSTRRVVHGMLSFLTAGVMAFVLFMIAEFTHPFSGAISVNSEAFVTTEEHIQQIDTLWATANLDQSKAVFKPGPLPSGIALLATPSPGAHRHKRHGHKTEQQSGPQPAFPAPGVPAPVVEPAQPTEPAQPSPTPAAQEGSPTAPAPDGGSPADPEQSS
jgi:hypothetical protein